MTSFVFRFARVSAQRIDWRWVRRSPWSLAQLGSLYFAFCLLCLVAVPSLWLRGYHWGWLALGLGMLLAGAALWHWRRHAQDAESISLQGARLIVERYVAGRKERAEFDRSRVHVEPKACDRSLITLSAQGHSMDVGRYVPPELRRALACEIRQALRMAL